MRLRNRADRLRKVLDLANRDLQSELAALGRIQKSVDGHVHRLDELEAYRQDYSNNFGYGEKLTPARWQDYQNFLNRINEAVAVQKNQVQAGYEAREAHRRRWLEKRQNLESIERVLDRYRQAEVVQDDRDNQRLLDDAITSCAFSQFYSDA